MSHFDPQLKATLAASLDVNGYSIIGKPETGTDGLGGDLDLVGGAAASTQALLAAQQQDRYTGVGDFGTFVGGDGAGGTAYVAAQTITLSDGSVVTVGSVDGNGDVLTFEVTTSGGTTVSTGVTLTQTSTSGTGAGFTLTPQIGNVTGSAGGNVILIPGAGAGSGSNGEIQLAGNLNVNDFNITSTIKDGGADHDINIFPGLSENDESTANDVNITGGALDYSVGGGTVAAGDVNITGGGLVNRNDNATGGSVNIVGASLPLQTVASDTAAIAGGVNITGGTAPESLLANGGPINITAGDGYSLSGTSNGGRITIKAGEAFDFAGDIVIEAGGSETTYGTSPVSGRDGGAVIIQASVYGGALGNYGGDERTTPLRFQGLQSNTTLSPAGRILDNFVGIRAPDNVPVEYTLILPSAEPTVGQVLSASAPVSDLNGTDVSTLSWATPAGGISNIVEDTTPQLGGNLDINGFDIVSINAAYPEPINITAGDGSTSTGASINLTAGDHTAVNSGGGSITLQAGGTTTAYYGGSINLYAGNGTGTAYQGGDINLTAGDGDSGGGPARGGDITIAGGDNVGSARGGHVVLQGGASVSGSQGFVQLPAVAKSTLNLGTNLAAAPVGSTIYVTDDAGATAFCMACVATGPTWVRVDDGTNIA